MGGDHHTLPEVARDRRESEAVASRLAEAPRIGAARRDAAGLEGVEDDGELGVGHAGY